MSIIDDIKLYFNKVEKLTYYYVVYYDEEGTQVVQKMELTCVREKDEKILKDRWIKKIVKKIDINDIDKVRKKSFNKKFLLNFLSLMEKGGIRDVKKGTFNYSISDTIDKIMYQDIENFDFYLYVSLELKKARKLNEILSDFKIFQEYIEFIKAVDNLEDEKRPMVFSLLKEKIYKTDEIKSSLISPAISPSIMLGIAIWIIVWFSNGIYPPLLSGFYTEWRDDLIPWLVSFIYWFGVWIIENWAIILFTIATIFIIIIAMTHFQVIQNIIVRQLLQVKLYKLYNEFFLWYIMKLYGATSSKIFSEIIRDLKETYSTQIYYFAIFDMIENYLTRWQVNIPLAKYSYIYTPAFLNIFTLMVKQKDLTMVENYLLTAEEDIKKEVSKFATILWLVGMITVGWVVMSLMLSFQMVTSATQSLYSGEG